jgi:hypothetical protein
MFSLSDYSLTDDILNIQQVDMLEGMHFSNSFQSQWHIYSTFEEEKIIYMSDLVQNRHLIQNVVMQIGPNLCLQSAICNFCVISLCTSAVPCPSACIMTYSAFSPPALLNIHL